MLKYGHWLRDRLHRHTVCCLFGHDFRGNRCLICNYVWPWGKRVE